MTEEEQKTKFELVFIEVYPKLKAYAWKLLKSEDDAEDVVQDVFAKLWIESDIWDKSDSLDGYLYVMVRNRIFNHIKRKLIETNYQDFVKSTIELSEFDIYDQLFAKETELLIKMTVNNMPSQRKSIFLMSRENNMSNAEIALKLNLSVRTVERHIYLALLDLKKIICIFLVSQLSNMMY